jgi:hypothetical protein
MYESPLSIADSSVLASVPNDFLKVCPLLIIANSESDPAIRLISQIHAVGRHPQIAVSNTLRFDSGLSLNKRFTNHG